MKSDFQQLFEVYAGSISSPNATYPAQPSNVSYQQPLPTDARGGMVTAHEEEENMVSLKDLKRLIEKHIDEARLHGMDYCVYTLSAILKELQS